MRGRKCHLLLEILDGFLNTVGSELANLLCFAATLKGDLDGTTVAYDKLTTRIVSCKSNLQLAYDCRVRHKKCRRILKHVSKSYDNGRYRQC